MVLDQYSKFVKPAFDDFILPQTTKHDFVFYSDQLIRLVVEHGLGHLPFTEKQVLTPTDGHRPAFHPFCFLVRHAQGFHNVAGEKDHNAYMSPELFDAALTPLGWQQVDNLRKHAHSSGLSKKIQLVAVSPLLRTMQTAVGVFGGGGFDDGINVAPLMTENAGESGRPAISSLNAPPFVAMELCREHLGVHWCDKRRSITEYKPLFPAIDFSLIESDEDTLWKLDVREANEELAERGLKFLTWLWTREESEIAVVTHSGFLIHTLASFGDDCHPSVKEEICKPFNNCELRSLVFVDRSMVTSSSSKTDFPGKIPDGSDAPSENGVDKN